ncbi:MAG: hypothetical protein WA977_05590, partial [Halobacteriota archaeon]
MGWCSGVYRRCWWFTDFTRTITRGNRIFRELVNSRTGKIFSPNTISTRLKELVEVGALERIITKTKRERDVVGYKITPEGLKALETSYK